MTSIIEDTDTDFETDAFRPIVQAVADLSHQEYGADARTTARIKTIADHARACTFRMAENLLPSNEKQGYVLRRLLRRSQALGRMIGIEGPFLGTVARTVIDTMKQPFPELVPAQSRILHDMEVEEQRFDHTLREGLVDELLLYQAPRLLGEGAGIAALGPFTAVEQALALEWTEIVRVGPDLRLRARLGHQR